MTSELYCICGNPKSSANHDKIVARLTQIRKEREDIAAQLGALAQEEGQLKQQLATIFQPNQ